MDILNFISWIKAGKYSPTMPADAITVVGIPNPTRGDAYLPVTVPVTAFGGSTGSNIGKLIGGGIVVGEWDENGVKKALIASLTNLGIPIPWTETSYQGVQIGTSAESFSDGLGNTDAIIAQTLLPADVTYAAGIARLHTDGGYNDWYLPAVWELDMCYNAAAIVNKVLGIANGFLTDTSYWSSTEDNAGLDLAWAQDYKNGLLGSYYKNFNGNVRAVRIHTL